MKGLVLAIACATAATALAQQQRQDSSTTKQPEVFLDNHRPLIQKKEKNPTSRVVSGQVVDDSGTPLENALVTLTNSKTNEKQTFFTKKDGRYQFEGLDFNKDYELQARYKNFSSEPRKVSQFDSTPRPVRILEINTGAKPAAASAENKKPQ